MFNWKTRWLPSPIISLVILGCTSKPDDYYPSVSADIPPPKPTYVQSVEVKHKILIKDNEPYVAFTFSEYQKLFNYTSDLVRYAEDLGKVVCYYEKCEVKTSGGDDVNSNSTKVSPEKH